jgi:Domain of unknown function (DUF4265)
LEPSKLIRLPIAVSGLSVKREVVIAAQGSRRGEYVIHSIPAFAYGLGRGDTIKMVDEETGTYRVLSRGGQITVRVFVNGTLTRPEVSSVVDEVLKLEGTYEVGKNATHEQQSSLLLLSLPSSAGFNRIEVLLNPARLPDCTWEYGNVYDPTGAPLNWWLEK